MKQRKWTLEQRLQQAQRIRQQKPWKHSTGPRTVDGKEKVSKNSYKHGGRCAEVRELAQNITEYKRQLNKLIEFIK